MASAARQTQESRNKLLEIKRLKSKDRDDLQSTNYVFLGRTTLLQNNFKAKALLLRSWNNPVLKHGVIWEYSKRALAQNAKLSYTLFL